MLGKWHLGYWRQAFTPVGRGFNSSFGFLGGYETYGTHMMWNGRYNATAGPGPNAWYSGPYITDLWESDHAATDPRYNGTCDNDGVCECTAAAIAANGGKSAPRCRYSSYLYTEKAVALIEQAAEQRPPRPHFFYFAVQSVHSPYQAPREYLDLFPHLPEDSLARREHAMPVKIPQRTFLDWTPCFSQPWPGFSFPRIALHFHDRCPTTRRGGPSSRPASG